MGTSLPMTAAAWSSRLGSGARRSMRAARMACTVAGIFSCSTGRLSRQARSVTRKELLMSLAVKEAPVQLGVYVDPPLKQQVERLAKANERTVSGEIRVALRRHLAYSAPVEAKR